MREEKLWFISKMENQAELNDANPALAAGS